MKAGERNEGSNHVDSQGMRIVATGSIWYKDCDRATPNVRPEQKRGTEGVGDGSQVISSQRQGVDKQQIILQNLALTLSQVRATEGFEQCSDMTLFSYDHSGCWAENGSKDISQEAVDSSR